MITINLFASICACVTKISILRAQFAGKTWNFIHLLFEVKPETFFVASEKPFNFLVCEIFILYIFISIDLIRVSFTFVLWNDKSEQSTWFEQRYKEDEDDHIWWNLTESRSSKQTWFQRFLIFELDHQLLAITIMDHGKTNSCGLFSFNFTSFPPIESLF